MSERSEAEVPPQRREAKQAPLALVVGVSVLVTLALGFAWQFARSHVVEAEPVVTRPAPKHPTPALSTSLASFRRVPTLVAADLEAQQSAVAAETMMKALTSAVGPGSCLQMVDGVAASAPTLAAAVPNEPVIPASNQKLLTAFTALMVLGPDYTYTTEVWGHPPVGGVVSGDIFLVGGGDPLLATSDFVDIQHIPSFNRTSLDALADQLKDAGITKIDGVVVGDGQRYDDEFRVESWGDSITSSEAGPYDALLVNDSSFEVGQYALEPNRAAAVQFKRLLDWRGITSASAGNFAKPADPTLVKLASITSRPLLDILAEMLQTSDNNTAEMVLKEIGFVATGVGTRQAGLDAMWTTLSESGIPLEGVKLADGSGLSRENRATCATLSAVLRTDAGKQMVDLLPVAGRSGTLYDQLLTTPAVGELHAKTGTLRDVKALSGEMPDRVGDPIVFALVLNRPQADEPSVYGAVWTELVDAIAAYPPNITIDPNRFEPVSK